MISQQARFVAISSIIWYVMKIVKGEEYSGKVCQNMNIIAAVDKKWAIGYQNKLLISIPDDMKYFRELTTGKVCIMGKNTLLSMPGGKPLRDRVSIVLTKDTGFKSDGAIVVNSVEEALERVAEYNSEDIFIIGGESIYRQFLPYADVAYITYIDYSYQADRYFPSLEEIPEWKLSEESEEQTYFNVEYYYRKYIRMSI